jgi:hypothetical protein
MSRKLACRPLKSHCNFPPDPIVYVNYRQRLRGDRDFTVVMRSAVPAGHARERPQNSP